MSLSAEITPERTHNVSDSIYKGLLAATSLGLEIRFTAFGKSLVMYRCDVTDAAGRRVVGKGKGIGSQAVASALFEAIEHYCLAHCTVQAQSQLRLGDHPLDAEIIYGSPNLSYPALKQAPPLTRFGLKKLNSPETEIAALAFLFDPEFESQYTSETEFLRTSGLRRYATNSGTAAGTTLEDAQLHALMELIERDSLSMELLTTVFSSNPKPVRKVLHESLTNDLRDLVELAESETGGKVTIWSITTELKVPSILVRVTIPSDMNYGYFGSGASLYVAYAIERALTEAVQGFHIYTAELCRPHSPNVYRPKQRTPYQRSLLEYGCFEYGGGEQDVSLSLLNEECFPFAALTVEEQIVIAVNALKNADVSVYFRVLFSNNVHVVQMYGPKLERFFLTASGVRVEPGTRGLECMALKQANLPKDVTGVT